MRLVFVLTSLISFSSAGLSYDIAMVGRCSVIGNAFKQEGLSVSHIDLIDIADPSRFNAKKFDCLLMLDSRGFAYDAVDNLNKFIMAGKDLVLLGGHAFSEPLISYNGRLLNKKQVLGQIDKAPEKIVVTKKFEQIKDNDWLRDCDNLLRPSKVSSDIGTAGRCAKFYFNDFTRWDTFRTNFSGSKGHNSIVFHAKGDRALNDFVLEICETDGSRWYKVIKITSSWQKYTVLAGDFQFIVDGSPAGRGYAKDQPNIANLAKIQFGLSFDLAPKTKQDYTLWVDEAGTAETIVPGDLGKPLFDVLMPVFYDNAFHHYKNSDSICSVNNSYVDLPEISMDISVSGITAIGYDYVNESKFIPCIEAKDLYGRRIGFVTGVVVHYDGKYKGGRWFISGVEQSDFYDNKIFAEYMAKALCAFQDDKLVNQMYNENVTSRKVFMPRPVCKRPAVRISGDGKTFEFDDGRKFFMLGVNYIGSFDRKCSHASDNFEFDYWDRDFSKAGKAGINCMRLWVEGLGQRKQIVDSILYLADKYNIYLLLTPSAHSMPTDKENAQLFKGLAELVKDEPMVIGFDLMNEPYITTVGSVSYDNGPSAILKHRTYRKYPGRLYSRDWVDNQVRSRSGWPELGNWIQGQDAADLFAAFKKAEMYCGKYIPSKDYSTLFGLDGKLRIEKNYEPFFEAVDQTFADWISLHRKAVGRDEYITVGYNTALAALQANQKLDFVSHHLYQKPLSFNDINKAVTTYDRLRKLWPDKPVSLGEFGYSFGTQLLDGSFLDIHSSGVAEAIIYMYAFANDYSGAMLWMLTNWPVPLMDYKAWWIDKSKQFYESGFGMFYYDGSRDGRAKPIVHFTRVLADYMKNHSPGQGTFVLKKSSASIGTGYVYKNYDALFVGDVKYKDSMLEYESDKMVNVMVVYGESDINITASCDTRVKLYPGAFGFKNINAACVEGKYAGLDGDDNVINIHLLEGQTVSFDWR